MAAFYPKCRECPHNTETGSLAVPLQAGKPAPAKPVHREPTPAELFREEGVRGVYLNEINRTRAEQITATFARLLWRERPLIGSQELDPIHRKKPRPVSSVPVPKVVVGYDQRPSAPDLVMGVYSRLRLMGCEVIDIGLSTKPCFLHTVHHLEGASGILVTGANAETSSIGLDFVGAGAVPWSLQGQLSTIQSNWERAASRPRRQSPPQRTFQAFVPYEASLWKHFHALRPLTIAVASPSRLVLRTLTRIFDSLPCTLKPMTLPLRGLRSSMAGDSVLKGSPKNDLDITQLQEFISTENADFGFLIEEDGMRCQTLDEQGQVVSSEELTLMLAELLLDVRRPVLLDEASNETLIATLRMLGLNVLTGITTHEETCKQLAAQNGLLAGGKSGYFWYNNLFPTADAILTLAHILQMLSRQVKPLSELRPGTIS
ncbi:Phosphomannomutase/phosphoglucomutase [Polystyrenella longa]|uniref:Phosphomannomutase/phosphoglucomutase n=2 Tax=Polystyrenella longa TaxID=2528007 RepID=A0A518CHM1_9PLAN|nr:Phosphomannomutase/phosphoglucomutase [Polystyrenella longa]